jgi:Uma2 family endonuclease
LATFEEFLAWALREGVRAEWVSGEVTLLTPASLEHQRLLDFLNDLVKAHIRPRQLGWVYFAPVAMKLPTRPSGREPDLLYVSAEHADRLKETFVDGPADLVVEIISPESDARDRGDKFVEYEGAGIREYWLIDPLRREATFFQLGDDGRYRAASLEPDGGFESAVIPGLRLRVAWLWRRPLPTVEAALSELA